MKPFIKAIICALIAGAPLQAEMSMFWEDLRAASNSLSAQACDGVDRAYNTLVYRAETYGDPTAMNSLAWLSVTERCQDYYTGDQFRAANLICASAEAGYPLAMSNCGLRHILPLGAEQDLDVGLSWIEAAMNLGYAEAGVYLARQYIHGENIPRNRADAGYWLERAEREGAPRDLVEAEWENFDNTFGTQPRENGSAVAESASENWLPPLSGTGFHRVEGLCVLKNGPVTLVAPEGKGNTHGFVGITNPEFNYSGRVGSVLDGHHLLFKFGTGFYAGIFVHGAPRVGSPDTLVLPIGQAQLDEIWHEHDRSCAVDYARADIEGGEYRLKDAKGERTAWRTFGDLNFWKKSTWFQFRDCASIFDLGHMCR